MNKRRIGTGSPVFAEVNMNVGRIAFFACLLTLAQCVVYLAVAYAIYQVALWIGRQ